ncbi:Mediator of RNA polymerase II transcription subunit 15a [Vitis vinifera]|uniref:Mediator of RNA polymerase II transcription subunit 15a n=1 Tax=Vitis vinifera TaxID=29760 RepID=A0A438IBE8_VITVI|nr:Mediator of RNA polymerase II transcription subunit 15a [Vitis vinifera]
MTLPTRNAGVSVQPFSHPTLSWPRVPLTFSFLYGKLISFSSAFFFSLILFSLLWNWELKDTNNQRPAQAEPVMDGGDWRTQLPPDCRQRIANKIMGTLKRHLPVSGPEGLHELRKIAERLEEKIYSAATSQMLTMETKSCNAATNSLPSNSAGPNKKSSNGKKSAAGKKSTAGKKSCRSR